MTNIIRSKHALRSLLMIVFALSAMIAPWSVLPTHAQSGNQWRIDFFSNLEWAGPPSNTQFSNTASFNWGTGSPMPNVPADNFTARFTTQAYFYGELYRVSVTADDEFVLYVDGVVFLNTIGQGMSGKTLVADIPMDPGLHSVQIDYREFTNTAYIFFNWAPFKSNPGGWVPSQPAVPPGTPIASATSVQTAFGDYTPCIQQNIHQANCFQSDGAWNSPNLGSIEMEPQIVVWGNCEADVVQTMQLYVNTDAQPAKCSRTAAGWFPN